MSKETLGFEQTGIDSRTIVRDPIAFPVESLDLSALQPNDTITGIRNFPELKKLTKALFDIDAERFGQYPGHIKAKMDELEKNFRSSFNGGVTIDTITYLGVDLKRDITNDETLEGHIFGMTATALISLKNSIPGKSFVLIVGTKPGGKLLVARLYNPETRQFDETQDGKRLEARQKGSVERAANELGGGKRRGNKPQGAQ